MAESGVGMPATLWLEQFGQMVRDAFDGEVPYRVGSSNLSTAWRDVDVRVMLDDEKYAAMGLGDPKYTHSNGKWVALCCAFSALGRQMTGLPIDFQIQQVTLANELYPNQRRSAIGIQRDIARFQVTTPTPEPG